MGGELVPVPHGDGPLLVPGEEAALQVAQVLRVLGRCLVAFPPKYFYVLETLCVCYNSKH